MASDLSPDQLLEQAKLGHPLRVRELRAILRAKRLPSSDNTLRRWIAEGKIEITRTRAGTVWIPGAEVLKVIAWQSPTPN